MKATRWMTGAALLFAGSTLTLFAESEIYKFDPVHSLVGFRVRHVVTKVTGRFKSYEGVVWVDRNNPSASRVEVKIDSASVDTANETRDNDLRSPNYFDVAKFPTITFKSTKIESKGSDAYDVTGEFTMHGVTKTIHVPVKLLGFQAMGKFEKVGFEVGFPISRKDYGMDKGAPVVGDDVAIDIQVEANKQAAEPAKGALSDSATAVARN
jgi:polyisoprenoid-binding protein YceI